MSSRFKGREIKNDSWYIDLKSRKVYKSNKINYSK